MKAKLFHIFFRKERLMRTRKGKPKTVFKTILNMALAMSIVLSSVAVPNVVKPITAHAGQYNGTTRSGEATTGHTHYTVAYKYDEGRNCIYTTFSANSNDVQVLWTHGQHTNTKDFGPGREDENNLPFQAANIAVVNKSSLGDAVDAAHAKDSDWNWNDVKQWLDNNMIPYDKLIFEENDKGVACYKNGVDIYVDDSIKHLDKVNRYGVKCYLFDNIYNRNDSYYERVCSFEELCDKIIIGGEL